MNANSNTQTKLIFLTLTKFAPLLFAIFSVFAWVTWTTHWDTGLYGDNVEQFVWVHSLEWGYFKHPPMPTWLLGAAIKLIGPHSWLTNALAAICFAVTGVLTWLITRQLFNEKVANVAIVLWTLQQCFSVSAQIYNHNTVLVMFIAASVYASLRAQSGPKSSAWWLGTGALAGCAMLSKYQAALPLFVLLVTLILTNKEAIRYLLTNFAFAGAGFIAVFSPHFYWAFINKFPTLRYASAAIESGGLMQRLAWIVTFFVNQIRMILPLLLVLALCFAICKFRPPLIVPAAAELRQPEQASIWLWGLVGAPILILLITSLMSGSQLRNHWGVQLFQFLPLWLAWLITRSTALSLTVLLPVAVVIHVAGFAYIAMKQSDPAAVQSERRADSAYPAEAMASAALVHWSKHTSCPLKIVAGDFEAGLVSAFLPTFPLVYSGVEATPWIKPQQIRQAGMLFVVDMDAVLPLDALATTQWYLNHGEGRSGKYVQFALLKPTESCY